MMKRCLVLAAALLALSGAPSRAQTVVVNAPVNLTLTNVAQSIKAARGKLSWGLCWNSNSSIEYLQLYDTLATVTVGTTPPKVWIPIPPTSAQPFYVSLSFLTAIQAAMTTTPTGGTAPATSATCAFGIQ